MKSVFLEGLKTAREIVAVAGIEALDALIAEHEAGVFETARRVPAGETR